MAVVSESDFHPDFGTVPQSTGIPSFLPFIAAIGLICIFLIGGACVLTAGHGHMWPSPQSQRYDLTKNT